MYEGTKKRVLNNIFEEVLKKKLDVQTTIKLAFEEGFKAGKDENNNK